MAGVPSQWEGTGQEEKGESGMAGVPSQWEGTGQEQKEKAGWPGFPRNGKERAGRKGESGTAGVPSQWKGTGQEEKGESGMAGAGRGSLAMGRNGPGGGERVVSAVGSGVRVGGCFGSGTGSGMNSADSARSFCCLGCAMVGLRAAGDSRLGRWGSSARRGVPRRSPGIVGRKKHGFPGGFGGSG
jgi:hypothetical protein